MSGRLDLRRGVVLTVEPLVVRIIRGLPLDADPDPYLKPRTADRSLEELWTDIYVNA